MKTLIQDLNSNVNEVDRWWLRLFTAIFAGSLLLFFYIIIYIFNGIYDCFNDYIIPVLKKKPFKGHFANMERQ